MSHAVVEKNPVFGISAEFESPDDLIHAAEKATEAGYTKVEAYTPFPVHGLTEAMNFDEAKVPWMIFIAGCLGGISGFALETWVSTSAYPLNVGGRPLFSWPSFIPVIFECTVLFAGLTAFFGTLAINGLPKPHNPMFGAENFERASQDRFFLCIESHDPQFDVEETTKFMNTLGAANVSQVRNDEDDL
ncbi:MAG: DUF3341 domain-containing protein [Fimbriimonadales bacterium]